MASRRLERVSEGLRGELSELFARDLDDPRLGGLSISSIRVSPDLGQARVFIRPLTESDEAAQQKLMSALRGAASRLRKALAPRLGMARVPRLLFEYDRGPDHRNRVEELLREIDEERES